MTAIPRGLALALVLLTCGAPRAGSQDADYPLVASLSPEDLLYRQITADVEAFHYAEAHQAAGATAPSLMIFRYRLAPADTIATVAARLTITQATLATLNRVSSPEAFRGLSEVLIANTPGLFVPDTPASELERSIAAARVALSRPGTPILLRRSGTPVSGRFYAGDDFSPQELIRFFRGFFRSPILRGTLSSRFGYRVDPFEGGIEFHGGIDIVAPKGTSVVAAQAGQVTEAGSDSKYGTYILITHEWPYQTLYAHLDTALVGLRDRVESGTIVGTVGDSGLTTGTHLHFEVRWKGAPVDPLSFLPLDWNRQ